MKRNVFEKNHVIDYLQANLYDRHVHSLKKVIKHYRSAFLLKDLVELFKILNICADRTEENEIYLQPLLDILKIVSKPFLKEKSSDEAAYEQIAVESVSQLGKFSHYPLKIFFKNGC